LVEIAKDIFQVNRLLASCVSVSCQVNKQLVFIRVIIYLVKSEHAVVVTTRLPLPLLGALNTLLFRNHPLFEFKKNGVKFAGCFLDVTHRGIKLVCRIKAAQVVARSGDVVARKRTLVYVLGTVSVLQTFKCSISFLLREEAAEGTVAVIAINLADV
jgi:hypothetical protein